MQVWCSKSSSGYHTSNKTHRFTKAPSVSYPSRQYPLYLHFYCFNRSGLLDVYQIKFAFLQKLAFMASSSQHALLPDISMSFFFILFWSLLIYDFLSISSHDHFTYSILFPCQSIFPYHTLLYSQHSHYLTLYHIAICQFFSFSFTQDYRFHRSKYFILFSF